MMMEKFIGLFVADIYREKRRKTAGTSPWLRKINNE